MNEEGILPFLQIILILVIVGVILYLLRFWRTSRLEKRLAPFAIASKKGEDISFFDKVGHILLKIVEKFSKFLSKSEVLTKYGEKYNKYIRFEERNEKTGIYFVAIKFVFSIFIVLLSFITVIFQTMSFHFMFFLLVFILSFFVPDIFWQIEFARKRKQVEDDLLKSIIIMNNSFQSGRNIMQAIDAVKRELDGPIQDEFKKIYLDITYGLSLDVVFNRFYERVKIEDAKYITTSLSLLNKTGGDIVKVFSMIEKSIFDKKNLENELHSLTASSRFVFKFLAALPFVFALLIFILNPTYFSPMFTTPIGIIIFIFILLLYVLYILVIKRVLRVEV